MAFGGGCQLGRLAASAALLFVAVGCEERTDRSAQPADGATSRLSTSAPVRLEAPQAPRGVEVALGDFHSCAVTGGRVWCRGSNLYGQLGAERASEAGAAVPVAGTDGAVSVVAGGNHTCALLADSTVRCWGLDQYGQTGHDGRAPAPVPGLRGVVALALGAEHSCALVENGAALCWGRDEEKQLGAPPSRRRPQLTGKRPPLSQLLPRNDQPRLVTAVSHAAQLVAGAHHTCARTADGAVWCWGDNRKGQLGLGRSSAPQRTPQRVPRLTRVVHLGAGGDQSCAALADGSVRCWGSYSGSFVAPVEPLDSPTKIATLTEVVRVAVGANRACASTSDESLRCWIEGPTAEGWYESGHPPAPVEGIPKARRAVLGLTAACATRPAGEVVCWGRNPYGMVASGGADLTRSPVVYGARLDVDAGASAPKQSPPRPKDGG